MTYTHTHTVRNSPLCALPALSVARTFFNISVCVCVCVCVHPQQLLLASALTPEQRELAETILESGNSLLGILGGYLMHAIPASVSPTVWGYSAA